MELRPWRDCPFRVGQRYRVVRALTVLRDAFTPGEELTFVRDVWSRYDGYTGYLFTDAQGRTRVLDVADAEPGEDWKSFEPLSTAG